MGAIVGKRQTCKRIDTNTDTDTDTDTQAKQVIKQKLTVIESRHDETVWEGAEVLFEGARHNENRQLCNIHCICFV